MSNITFKTETESKGQTIYVNVDGSLVGRIKLERQNGELGWRYWVARARAKGEFFKDLEELKADLVGVQ